MVQTKVFKINGSQAVRIPKDVALPDGIKLVDIVAVGNRRIVSPVAHAWDEWFENGSVSADFMKERLQTATQARKPFKA